VTASAESPSPSPTRSLWSPVCRGGEAYSSSVDDGLVNLSRKDQRGRLADTPAGREYSCQWIVKPHWRQQAYGPGRSLRKAILIAEHIRGPQDKPLRVRDAVKVWREH
jgi:hypothetical protein